MRRLNSTLVEYFIYADRDNLPSDVPTADYHYYADHYDQSSEVPTPTMPTMMPIVGSTDAFFYADPNQPPSEIPSDMSTSTTPDTTTSVGCTDIYFDYADYYLSTTDLVFQADEFWQCKTSTLRSGFAATFTRCNYTVQLCSSLAAFLTCCIVRSSAETLRDCFSAETLFHVIHFPCPTMCTDITVPVVQRRYHAAIFVVGSFHVFQFSWDFFFASDQCIHTLYVIHVPLCSAIYMLHRRALHRVAYETFAIFVPVYTDVPIVTSLRTRLWFIYFVACATRLSLRLRHVRFQHALRRCHLRRLYVVRVLCTNCQLRSGCRHQISEFFIYFRFGCRYQTSDVSVPDAATSRPMFPLPVYISPMDSYFYTWTVPLVWTATSTSFQSRWCICINNFPFCFILVLLHCISARRYFSYRTLKTALVVWFRILLH